MLVEKVNQTIVRHRMLGTGRVVVGVSGGVDSVVLLDVLIQIIPRRRVVIAHLDHMIRGAAARADARFVAELGERMGIPVVTDRVDVPRISHDQGVGLEDAGRRARDEFFRRVAASHGADRIAVGHTRDDLVETVIFNLVRGAGPTGLGGIRPVRLPYVRPLIDVTRAEIVAYARARGLAWREDATNQDIRLTRNLIRHRVIPLLEAVNPQVRAAVARAAELMRAESMATAWLLDPVWDEMSAVADGEVVIDRARLAALPEPVQRLILRRGIAAARGALTGITSRHVDILARLITRSPGSGHADLPGLRVELEREHVRITHADGVPDRAAPPVEVHLNVPGRTVVAALGVTITLTPMAWTGGGYPPGRNAELADADRIELPLYVRTRRPGDRFRPLGMQSEKKLKDVLIDAKVPLRARARLPLICDQAGIIWVVGVRLADRVKVTERTKNAVLMQVEEIA